MLAQRIFPISVFKSGTLKTRSVLRHHPVQILDVNRRTEAQRGIVACINSLKISRDYKLVLHSFYLVSFNTWTSGEIFQMEDPIRIDSFKLQVSRSSKIILFKIIHTSLHSLSVPKSHLTVQHSLPPCLYISTPFFLHSTSYNLLVQILYMCICFLSPLVTKNRISIRV